MSPLLTAHWMLPIGWRPREAEAVALEARLEGCGVPPTGVPPSWGRASAVVAASLEGFWQAGDARGIVCEASDWWCGDCGGSCDNAEVRRGLSHLALLGPLSGTAVSRGGQYL